MVNPGPHLVWSDGTLVPAAGSAASGFQKVGGHERLVIGRTATGGTYGFEIDWSRDGTTVDFTQAVTVADADSASVDICAPYARFRVNNTGGADFTAHRTNVMLFAR